MVVMHMVLMVKKIKGRKYHIVTDTLGLILVIV